MSDGQTLETLVSDTYIFTRTHPQKKTSAQSNHGVLQESMIGTDLKQQTIVTDWPKHLYVESITNLRDSSASFPFKCVKKLSSTGKFSLSKTYSSTIGINKIKT